MVDVTDRSGNGMSRRPAAFFDRDGVINIDHGYVHTADRLEFVSGAADALRMCRAAGFLVFVVTNQAGVAHGLYGEEAVVTLHLRMNALLAEQGASIDDFRYCPHHREAKVASYALDCGWRKPAPGMIFDLARHWEVDLGRSFLIGDKITDMAAAQAAGIPGYQFSGGNLARFVEPILQSLATVAVR